MPSRSAASLSVNLLFTRQAFNVNFVLSLLLFSIISPPSAIYHITFKL
nr:MAG TPA: hypothetical protein [Caudoviricetes sp.]